MKFAFDDQATEFRDAVRDVLAQHCDSAALRSAWNAPSGRTATAWSALHEMGVLDALRPEADGGLGLTEVDVVLVLEESGRWALPEPIVETMLIAAPLGLVASGESAAVVCPEAPHALWADTAAAVIELGRTGVRCATRDGVTLTPHDSVDGARRLFDVALPADTPVVPGADVALAFRRGVLGHAAQLCGLADRMLELTVDYAKERKQFGAPIGSFQAVKHHLANARIGLEFARPLVWRAAASLRDGDPDAGVHTSAAKAAASEAAAQSARAALQCHGAIGYTTEYDLHLLMKRSWALCATWGDAAWHRRRIAAALLD
jgi:alkylation response protein AidB-like acyl-CoA dehydrogenase